MTDDLEYNLSLRDSKTKRFVKHFKLDSYILSKNNIAEYFLNIQNLINRLDFKYMTIIKSSINYHFQGLIDLPHEKYVNPGIIKYTLQSELIKLIDASFFDLNTKICDPSDIKNIIEVVANIYYCIKKIIPDVKGATENQDIIFEEKLLYLIDGHNVYIDYLLSQYNFEKNCLIFSVPQNLMHALQISNAINTRNINMHELKKLYVIEHKNIIDSTNGT